MATKPKFEVISADEVEVAPRGRSVETNPDLIAAFANLKPGQAVRLEGLFGTVAKDDQPKIGALIRKNWKAARGGADKCRIDFGTSGVPQVQVKVTKD